MSPPRPAEARALYLTRDALLTNQRNTVPSEDLNFREVSASFSHESWFTKLVSQLSSTDTASVYIGNLPQPKCFNTL